MAENRGMIGQEGVRNGLRLAAAGCLAAALAALVGNWATTGETAAMLASAAVALGIWATILSLVLYLGGRRR